MKKRTFLTTYTLVSTCGWHSQPCSVGHLDMWGRESSTIFRSMCLRRARHNKRDVLQHKDVNILQLMEKRMFWAALPYFTQSLSGFILLCRHLRNAPLMQLMSFPCERFIYGRSSSVTHSHLANNGHNTDRTILPFKEQIASPCLCLQCGHWWLLCATQEERTIFGLLSRDNDLCQGQGG